MPHARRFSVSCCWFVSVSVSQYTAAIHSVYMFWITLMLWMYGCTVWTVEAVQPPSVRGSVGGLPSKVYRLAPGLGEGLLAVKSAKPCSPFQIRPPCRSASNALPFLRTRCACGRREGWRGESEGGREGGDGGVRFDGNTGTSSYHLVK